MPIGGGGGVVMRGGVTLHIAKVGSASSKIEATACCLMSVSTFPPSPIPTAAPHSHPKHPARRTVTFFSPTNPDSTYCLYNRRQTAQIVPPRACRKILPSKVLHRPLYGQAASAPRSARRSRHKTPDFSPRSCEARQGTARRSAIIGRIELPLAANYKDGRRLNEPDCAAAAAAAAGSNRDAERSTVARGHSDELVPVVVLCDAPCYEFFIALYVAYKVTGWCSCNRPPASHPGEHSI
jgi:hypothetical protein